MPPAVWTGSGTLPHNYDNRVPVHQGSHSALGHERRQKPSNNGPESPESDTSYRTHSFT